MSVIHKHHKTIEGGAACGANIMKDYETGEPKLMRRFLFLEKEGLPATCKRCCGTVKRVQTAPITEDMTGIVFHRSFGYDMTINVFAKVIRHTPKGLLCQECNANTNGLEHGYTGEGRATAGGLKTDAKPFVMLKKATAWGEYWAGQGEHWSPAGNRSYYENRCD